MTKQTVATRNPSWFGMGYHPGEAMTATEAMTYGGLAGWDVRKEPLFTESGIEVPNRVATVRTEPATGETVYLGYVGHNYTIQQNEETFEFLDALVDESGANYDTAGYFDRGQRVFTTMKMPEGISVGGQDAVDLYLLATNGHDGFNAFKIAVVPMRLACTNQLTAALRNAQQVWSIRHTTNMAGRLAEARASLELTFDYMDAFTAEMEMLLDQEYTNGQFEALTKYLVPDAKSDARQERVNAHRRDLFHLFTEAETNEFGRGTKYAAWNAVTEWADWVRPVRGDDAKRAEAVLAGANGDGIVQNLKDAALRHLTTV